MDKKNIIILVCAVLLALAAGFGIGIYVKRAPDDNTNETISIGQDSSTIDNEAVGSDTDTDAETDGADNESAEDKAPVSSDTDAGEYILNYSSNNTWQDGDITMMGIDWQIVNGSEEPLREWEIEIGIKGLAKAEGWNGTFGVNGDTLTVKNADYNGNVAKGASVEFGCNLGIKADDLEVAYARVNGSDCKVSRSEAIKASGSHEQNGNDRADGNGTDKKDVAALLERSKDALQGDDWLHTDGRRILDESGKEVWITGLNWFGYNTGTNTFDGLSNSEMVPVVKSIADHGFNIIRVPMSAQLLNEWAAGEYPKANYNNAYNQEMNAMNSLEIFDYFLTLAESNGLKVMIDIHSAETDPSGHMTNLWYTEKVSEKEYTGALKWVAARYKDNDTVIAIDLKNEPHGKPNEGSKAAIWNDSDKENNWKMEAQKAALAVLEENPNVLVLVEGIETYPIDIKTNGDYRSKIAGDYHITWWGGNLRGVRDFPIELGKYRDKLVYSPHDYGPTVYDQPWFYEGYDYNSLMNDCWRDNWFYIYEDEIAPLFVGEWGGFMREPNLKWMKCFRDLIAKYRLNHTFWCLNPNSVDTGGLLLDDFKTWDEDKYGFVKEVLWQKDDKFVGLDHKIPLGDNGISLSDL